MLQANPKKTKAYDYPSLPESKKRKTLKQAIPALEDTSVA
jgi:hypothetical protein